MNQVRYTDLDAPKQTPSSYHLLPLFGLALTFVFSCPPSSFLLLLLLLSLSLSLTHTHTHTHTDFGKITVFWT